MNRVMLIGRLTRDLEVRNTPSGASVLRFSVAVDRRVQAGSEPQADFINCVAWNKTAELMAQYLHKGSKVAVEGRIQTGSYDKEGTRVYTTDVVAERVQFLDPKPTSGERGYSTPSYESDPAPMNDFDESLSLGAFDPSSEDLPF